MKIWETTVQACDMFTSGFLPRLKDVACLNFLISYLCHVIMSHECELRNINVYDTLFSRGGGGGRGGDVLTHEY